MASFAEMQKGYSDVALGATKGMMQGSKTITEGPGPNIGGGIMAGVGGALAASALGSAIGGATGGAIGGPPGMLVGAGIGLLSYFLS